jgi:hypothetical protein
LTTERSEWQSPAAATLTNTSPLPGGSSSISSITAGRLVANGWGNAISRSTAALIFIVAVLLGIFARLFYQGISLPS